MFVYQVHLEVPFNDMNGGKQQHYVGSSKDLDGVRERITRHGSSTGSDLLGQVNQAHINWWVVRLWLDVPAEYEFKLKHGHQRNFCPVCCGRHLHGLQYESVIGEELDQLRLDRRRGRAWVRPRVEVDGRVTIR